MVKKKNKHSDKTFFDVVGLKNILQNDIVNFIFGIVLLLLSIYMIIAFMSFFSTGQYDQSLILDHSPQDVLNKDREFRNSCGSVGAFVSYFFISRCFGFSSFIIPVFMGMAGLKLVKAYKINLLKWFVCLMIAMVWLSIAAAKVLTPIMGSRIFNPGGDHGLYCSQWIENVIGVYGLTALLLLSAIIFLTYLSKETINVVRNILNPVGKLTGTVKFGIRNITIADNAAFLIYPLPLCRRRHIRQAPALYIPAHRHNQDCLYRTSSALHHTALRRKRPSSLSGRSGFRHRR